MDRDHAIIGFLGGVKLDVLNFVARVTLKDFPPFMLCIVWGPGVMTL